MIPTKSNILMMKMVINKFFYFHQHHKKSLNFPGSSEEDGDQANLKKNKNILREMLFHDKSENFN
jgi:hypothetical protein